MYLLPFLVAKYEKKAWNNTQNEENIYNDKNNNNELTLNKTPIKKELDYNYLHTKTGNDSTEIRPTGEHNIQKRRPGTGQANKYQYWCQPDNTLQVFHDLLALQDAWGFDFSGVSVLCFIHLHFWFVLFVGHFCLDFRLSVSLIILLFGCLLFAFLAARSVGGV